MAIFDPADDTEFDPTVDAQLGTDDLIDDPTKDIHLWDLTPRERRVFEAGFLLGHSSPTAPGGEIERLRQLLEQAERDADRYYTEMCRRPALRQPEHIPYAELCRRRGDPDRAERAEQQIADMFPQYAH